MKVLTPQKQWDVLEHDAVAVKALADELAIPPLAARLMIARGITGAEAGRRFLEPSLDDLCDPFSLTGMDRAVARIHEAKARQEKVRVFGDYDVDGISAAAILSRALLRFGIENVDCGMPDRLLEGYGIGPAHIDEAVDDGVGLIITVDNGVRAYAAATRARERGIALIITDHHSIDGELPHACAVVNPQQEPEDHPCRCLCGAGIAFKVGQALNGTKNDLDIAAVGTVADLVPLRGENRVIVALGLRHMKKHKRVGLAHLAAAARIDMAELRAHHIGFQLGPRLNAAGRIAQGHPSLQLLLSDCAIESRRIAQELDAANEERREIEKAIYEACMEELKHTFMENQRAIVLAHHDWHPGVIGIVASRIQARYYRPVVLLALNGNGTAKGSARGIPGFDTVGAFTACEDILVQYGGHTAAAGVTLRIEHLDDFSARFEAEARRQLGDGPLTGTLHIDALASLSDIDTTLMNTIKRIEPMGMGNPSPVFCSYNVELVPGSARMLRGNHIKFAVRQDGRVFDCIAFSLGERIHAEELPNALDIAYTPDYNTFRGETTIQLVLKDLRPAG
jgi:single-stranded-DNA-specific exonuclease